MSELQHYEKQIGTLSDLELAVMLTEHIEITQITKRKLTDLWCKGSILERESRKRTNDDIVVPHILDYSDLDQFSGQQKIAFRRLRYAQVPGWYSLVFLFQQHRLQQSLYPIRNVGHKMVEVITEYIKGLQS